MKEIFKNNIPKEQFVCGNKFIRLADELGFHFSKIDFWREEIQIASEEGSSVFLTHQGDNPVTQEMVDNAPKNIKYWFASNCLAESTNTCEVVGIPLGLNNVDLVVSRSSRNGKYSSDFSHVTDFHENIVIARSFSSSLHQKNLAYVNFNVNTNREQRGRCLEYFSNKAFATIESPNRTHLEYLKEALCYPFIVSPPGNGNDCIRVWETLYLGRIPIVLNIPSMKHFRGLPIMFVDSWEEIDEKSLENFYHNVTIGNEYDLGKITIDYWKERLLESLGENGE